MAPATITMSHTDLITRRDALLSSTGLGYDELRERADAYTLTEQQRQAWESIRTLDYLLADKW